MYRSLSVSRLLVALLGIVEQDIFLFDGTVAQNIGYARRGATSDEIKHVAKLAHVDEFITRE